MYYVLCIMYYMRCKKWCRVQSLRPSLQAGSFAKIAHRAISSRSARCQVPGRYYPGTRTLEPATLNIDCLKPVIMLCNSRYGVSAWTILSVSRFHEKKTNTYCDADNIVGCNLLLLSQILL
jgi:hypothetical protein